VTSALLCVPYQSDFSKIADPHGERATFRAVETARRGEFDFGADLSKKEGFSSKKKNTLIGHRSISLQLVCAKITSCRMIAVERRSAQKLHSSAFALLEIFDLIFAGSRVATRFCDVTYVPYLLRTFYLSVTISPP